MLVCGYIAKIERFDKGKAHLWRNLSYHEAKPTLFTVARPLLLSSCLKILENRVGFASFDVSVLRALFVTLL